MRILTLSPTNRCPLKCNHCGPASGPDEKEFLNQEKLQEALVGFKNEGCNFVNISGGEPFMLGERLVDLVRFATSHEISVRITTSAYWAKTQEVAARKIEELCRVGLKDIYISLSDGHLEFIQMINAFNAATAGMKLGLKVVIGIATHKSSELSVKKLLDFFESNGGPIPYLNVVPLIPFGRAALNFDESQFSTVSVEQISGPCSSVLEHPTVHPNGDVTPCASVFSKDCGPLKVGNINESSPSELVNMMNKSPLFLWIHKFGVVALKDLIEKSTDIRFKSNYGNICHLCGDILHNKDAVNFLKQSRFL